MYTKGWLLKILQERTGSKRVWKVTSLLTILVAMVILGALLGAACTSASTITLMTPEEKEYWFASLETIEDSSGKLNNIPKSADDSSLDTVAYLLKVAALYETIPENCLAKLQTLAAPPLFDEYHRQIISEWETNRVFGDAFAKMFREASTELIELPKSSRAFDDFQKKWEVDFEAHWERWNAVMQTHRAEREAEITRINGVLSVRLLDPIDLDAKQ